MYVDDIYLMNVGLRETRELILEQGIVIRPKNQNGRVTLSNVDSDKRFCMILQLFSGFFAIRGSRGWCRFSKRDLRNGRLGVLLLPQERDLNQAIAIVERVPILESAVRKPLKLPGRESQMKNK
ncbi:YIEGIA domain-containing protein [Marinithermofilum abyssi]|uniref:YIEGIA domain-containing protein n=1 Tax=Marinithermofilum abyssi TaxID=1571185 RepID=UPI001E2BDCE0|nr:YIEGIA domain-containing protein [Marinithermofilum abyssi]